MDGIPDVCKLESLTGVIQNCIAYYLSLGNGAARSDAINAMIEGWQEMVNNATFADNVGTYPGLEALDEADGNDNNDIVIICTNNDPSGCPSDGQLAEIMVQLLNGPYNISDLENAALDGGTSPPSTNAANVIEGIFNCIDQSGISTMSISVSPFSFREQDTTTFLSQSVVNTENTQQETTTPSSQSRTTSQHEFRLPNLPFTFNGLGVVNEDPR
jgi:hypothetical protein